MAKTLQMVFQNEAGKNVNLSIANIKETLAAADVKTVMQKIIEKNIFNSTGGELKVIAGASIIDRNESELTVK